MSGRSQFYPLFQLFQNRIFYSMGESGGGGVEISLKFTMLQKTKDIKRILLPLSYFK